MPSSKLRRLLGALITLNLVSVSWAACGDTEQDRLVWARERMHPGATPAQLRLVYQWLVNATHSCTSSGDLWYYRGLAAKKLPDLRDAEYAFRKADEFGSKSKGQGFDPFLVVTHSVTANPNALRDKWALIVGVSSFEKSDDFLEFSAKDARDLYSYLLQSGNFKKDHVQLLIDKDATAAKIREAFGDLRAQAKADDLVLVYFSSHGLPRQMDPTGLSYVLTYDTDQVTPGKKYATSLQMVELAELGRWVLARDYVLLLDTCFSGAARAGVTGQAVPSDSNGLDPLQGLQGSGNRVVISASRADEQSYEDVASKHGYFTQSLLEALRKDGATHPLSGIFDYLQSRVSDQVGKTDGRQQHPVMQSFGQGQDIILSGPVIATLFPTRFGNGLRIIAGTR